MKVPHIRIEVPKDYAGKIMTARGMRVFMTLPYQEEVELVGVRGFTGNLHIDDIGTVTLELAASYEINHAD